MTHLVNISMYDTCRGVNNRSCLFSRLLKLYPLILSMFEIKAISLFSWWLLDTDAVQVYTPVAQNLEQ